MMLFTPGTSLIYIAHFLLVLHLLIYHHFTTFDVFQNRERETQKTNEIEQKPLNHEASKSIRYNIPLIFDEDATKFEKIIIDYLNSIKSNSSQIEFVPYQRNAEYLLNTCIYVMEESHKGLILSQKREKIDKWKSKFENIIIIAFRDGEFTGSIRNLTLSNYQIIEILYMDKDIIKESSRNKSFINSLFDSLVNIMNRKLIKKM